MFIFTNRNQSYFFVVAPDLSPWIAAVVTYFFVTNHLSLILSKKPHRNAFRNGLIQGDKLVIYPILQWLFENLAELKTRAYLARYLVKLEIPPDQLADQELNELNENVSIYISFSQNAPVSIFLFYRGWVKLYNEYFFKQVLCNEPSQMIHQILLTIIISTLTFYNICNHFFTIYCPLHG